MWWSIRRSAGNRMSNVRQLSLARVGEGNDHIRYCVGDRFKIGPSLFRGCVARIAAAGVGVGFAPGARRPDSGLREAFDREWHALAFAGGTQIDPLRAQVQQETRFHLVGMIAGFRAARIVLVFSDLPEVAEHDERPELALD